MASIEKSPSKNKTTLNPFLSTEFVDELLEFFSEEPVGMTAVELTEAFNGFSHLPIKWSARKLKQFLTKSQVMIYSRKKPAGFSLDRSQIQEYAISETSIQIKPRKKSPKSTLALKKRDKKSTTSIKSRTSIPSISKKIPSRRSQSIAKSKTKTLTTSKSQIKSKSKTKSKTRSPTKSISTKRKQPSIADTIPSYPKYLVGRMPKAAQKALNLGGTQIQNLSLKKLSEAIEYLTASKMFFDSQFVNERNLIQGLDERIGFMSKLSEKIHEEQATLAFNKYFFDMYNQSKFDKIIKKWGSHYDIEQCSYLCLKKMGKKAKKISISEYALRKMIKEVLLDKHPQKA
ncbi:MAG: hypothetical protein ACTSYU_02000 [Promethearchaeota archaeon]